MRLGACVYPKRMYMSSLQDLKMVMHVQVKSNEESQAPGLSLSDLKQPSAAEKPQLPENHHSTGSKQVQMQRLVEQKSLLLSMLRLKGAIQAHPWSLSFCVYCGFYLQDGWRNC